MLKAQALLGTLVINGNSLALAALAKGKHMIVATDATPRLTARMRAPGSGIGAIVHRVLDTIYHHRFKRLVRGVDAWLPISETCKKSLVADYGADPGRCYVTRSPQPIIDVSAVRKVLSKTPELLFVGNDFRRKGGHTLLEAFRHGWLPQCKLTIISNDDSLQGLEVQGVNVVRGLSDPAQIAIYYKRADLLVLPTLYDVYSNVVCEGLAFCLPFVATTIGAIGEIVEQSGAGLPLEPKCSPRQLATAVMELLSNEDRYLAMSQAACAYACNYLAVALLDNQIRQALLVVGATL